MLLIHPDEDSQWTEPLTFSLQIHILKDQLALRFVDVEMALQDKRNQKNNNVCVCLSQMSVVLYMQ